MIPEDSALGVHFVWTFLIYNIKASYLVIRAATSFTVAGAALCGFTTALERAGEGDEGREGESPGSRYASEPGAEREWCSHPPQPPTILPLCCL